jgi:hypothetical protein
MRWVVAAALLLLPAAAQADVLITISKAHQQMDVSVDGAPAYHWTVSTGRPGYATPTGSFRAIRLERVYFSRKYDDAPMPNAVFFHGGYAIHGTFEERRLGRAVSHGCVRLARANAAALFALVRAHGMARTRIVVVDGVAPGEVPVARAAPRERHAHHRATGRERASKHAMTERKWREEGFRRGFVARKPAMRSARRTSRENWRSRRHQVVRAADAHRVPRVYVTRAAPLVREVVVIRHPPRGRGLNW